MARGSSARSGPAPDPNALRRDRDGDGWITLPQEGRDGPTPEWPLSDPSQRELELWEREWRRPQAVMWEQNGQEVEVAMFVRALKVAENPNAPTNSRTLVRQMMEGLGISIPGMQRNKWRIGDPPKAKRSRASSSSVKDRLKVVQGDA